MPRIAFTPNLRRHLDCPTQHAPGATLREALDAVFAGNPRLRGYLLDEHGRLRKHVTIFINDSPASDRTTLGDTLAPEDEVFVFQALSGG
jgi:hypothetical protein